MLEYFAVDPLPHYNRRKQQALRRFSRNLQKVFHKSREEIFQASSSYTGKPRELLNFLFTISSWQYFNNYELKPKARTLAVTTLICIAESLFSGPPGKRLYKFLRQLNDTDKRTLLGSYLFSSPTTTYPVEISEHRHLMYEDMLDSLSSSVRTHYQSQHCSARGDNSVSFCECENWLINQDTTILNRHLKKLSEKLYDMRSAVFHDATPVGFCHSASRPSTHAYWSMTIVDLYSRRHEGYSVSYSSDLSRTQLEEIFLRGIWNIFEAGPQHRISPVS